MKDTCERCRKVIPKAKPYTITNVMSGPRKGERIPPTGVLCEPCMVKMLLPIIDGPPVVLDCQVYH